VVTGVNDVSALQSILCVLVLVLPAACAGPSDWAPRPATINVDSVPGPYGAALSQEARKVSRIANVNGARDYLMLDKAHGTIIVFEGGQATFMGAALTGEYPADYLLPDATRKNFHETTGLKYKVTPAGRYTVSMGYDPAYGDTLDVNEIQGIDWDIAIHKVWLGAPSEHRDVRLRTPSYDDKHITYGCIDVDGPTMKQILARLPGDDATPIYILPQDENLIMKFFQPRDAVRRTSSPAG
jgi:hypothetical protein